MLKFPRKIEKKAKSVEEAKAAIIAELGVLEEEVKFEVVDEGTKGFLGLGSKEALVTASLIEPEVSIAKLFLTGVMESMQVKVDVTASMNDEGDINIELEGDSLGIIIGKRGDTLDSLQYLTSLVVNRESDKYIKVIIDAENYREKRYKALVSLSDRLAAKVARTGKRHTLEPMNPYERRIIHSNLQNNEDVTTRSVGEDPYRKVVIEPKHAAKSYYKKPYAKHSDFESYIQAEETQEDSDFNLD